MGFPNIKLNEPTGEEYVSQIDDFERETRSWLKQIVNIITGYPLVETLAVKVWGTGDRPTAQTVNSINKTIIGFNSDTNELEVLQPDAENNTMNVLGISKQILNTIYPIGSYYETSDATFNPNTAWGGTWVLDTPGRVMVGTDYQEGSTSYTGRKIDVNGNVISGSHPFTPDEIGVEEEHCLARPELPSLTNGVSEMPIHYHPHRHPHSHAIEGSFIKKVNSGANGYVQVSNTSTTGSIGIKYDNAVTTGLPNEEDKAYSMTANEWFDVAQDFSLHGMVDADTPKPTEQRTVSEDLIMHVGSKIGQNGHNNLQPYKVCYRWHRVPDPEQNNG